MYRRAWNACQSRLVSQRQPKQRGVSYRVSPRHCKNPAVVKIGRRWYCEACAQKEGLI